MNSSEQEFRDRFVRLMEENKQNMKKKLTNDEDDGIISTSSDEIE